MLARRRNHFATAVAHRKNDISFDVDLAIKGSAGSKMHSVNDTFVSRILLFETEAGASADARRSFRVVSVP